jgi:hypothetical protein
LSLGELLTRPRSQLAEWANEWSTKIHLQEKARREALLPYGLMPELRLPLVVPVWREAKYSPTLGFSLPPYTPAESKDTEMALHLARYGDTEAACKLVAPQDTEALSQIEAGRFERDYPVEWTRLIGLMLHAAQVRLATGDADGEKELVGLNRQLTQVLDPKAAAGALGSALLGRGRKVLARAETAWRANQRNDLADQAKADLAEWSETPAPTLPVRLGTPRALVSRTISSHGTGRTLATPDLTRALDLWALPFPDQGADSVLVCFDPADHLTDVFLLYRTGQGEHYPQPAALAHIWEEHGLPARDLPRSPGLNSRSYSLAEWTADVLIVTHGAGVGALLHLSGGQETPPPSFRLTRDFGTVRFERSFEQNRMHLAYESRGSRLASRQPEVLAQLVNPLPLLKPTQAVIEQASGRNLTASVRLSYNIDASGPPELARLTLPLWAVAGPPRLRGVEDEQGGHLALVWEDGQTRYLVELPYEPAQPVQFEAVDLHDAGQMAQREADAATFDLAERRARFQAGKPLQRLPRDLEQFELGMTRSQITQALPTGQAILKRPIAGGLAVTFTGEPADGQVDVLRQLMFRFDAADRAVELRARYQDGPAVRKGDGELLAAIRKRGGAAQEVAPIGASLWTELPPRRPAPHCLSWHDDRTRLTYLRERGGVEVVLRDCPVEHERGYPLPPLDYLPRGPEPSPLGTTRAGLVKMWGLTREETTEDGALVLRPTTISPYDAVLVWFEQDRVVRVVARHRNAPTNSAGPAHWCQAVSDAWARDLRTIGWPRRFDHLANNGLQSLACRTNAHGCGFSGRRATAGRSMSSASGKTCLMGSP